MGFGDCTLVFRMELYADKPFQFGDFNDFRQTGFRIDSGSYHASLFKLIFVFSGGDAFPG